jgi:hypothetical protein
MAKEAVTKALLDCGLSYDKIEQAAVGYCYGDSTCGQRALYQLGMTQIPIMSTSHASAPAPCCPAPPTPTRAAAATLTPCSLGSGSVWLQT